MVSKTSSFSTVVSRRLDDPQAKLLSPRNHLPEKLIHGVGVYARPIRNARPQMRTHPPQEARCCRRLAILRIVGEDAPQVLIIVVRPIPGKILTLLRVVLTQSVPQLRCSGSTSALVGVERRLTGDLSHQLVDVLELLKRRPTLCSPLRQSTWGLSQIAKVSAKSSTGCACAYQLARLMT